MEERRELINRKIIFGLCTFKEFIISFLAASWILTILLLYVCTRNDFKNDINIRFFALAVTLTYILTVVISRMIIDPLKYNTVDKACDFKVISVVIFVIASIAMFYLYVYMKCFCSNDEKNTLSIGRVVLLFIALFFVVKFIIYSFSAILNFIKFISEKILPRAEESASKITKTVNTFRNLIEAITAIGVSLSPLITLICLGAKIKDIPPVNYILQHIM